ncbi:hypothetical protein HHL08_15860 [Sphingobium sp. AR-3-1]|uniref:SGNH hydrolase-type esterase domain-containing protein n=1 Tax=Sphingobium psychrophilum TaxID=2728834 RepID=A0A7X9ZUG3_9SPHN|nr:SGNH/GDSL hydrolase family protein [Sphingobium psychrophilum]NML11606.1 hypothetical protein [Sphingobium psychrophilum]
MAFDKTARDGISVVSQQMQDSANRTVFETLSPQGEMPIISGDRRRVAGIPLTAAGVRYFETLSSRRPILLDDAGHVLIDQPGHALSPPALTGPNYRPDRLRKTSIALGGIEAGATGYRLNITLFGDSWVDTSNYWLRTALATLRTRYGDGGIGYVDFGSPDFLRPEISKTVSGWTVYDTISSGVPIVGPALYMRSGSVGASLTLTCTDGPIPTSPRLIFEGTDDGVMSYAWNGGAPTSINVQGASMGSVSLGSPPSARNWTLALAVTAGTARIAGVTMSSAADGVTINKVGNNGTRSIDWSAADAAKWIAGIAAIPTDLAVILLGTNDVRDAVSAATYAANLKEIVRRIRLAHPATANLPGPDILLVVPPEVYRTTGRTPMKPYLAAVLASADALDVAVLDLTESLGDPYTRRDWFDTDGVHTQPATAGQIIARRVVKTLTA